MKTPNSTNKNSNPIKNPISNEDNSSDYHWYTDDEMNMLLVYYRPRIRTELFTGMTEKNWRDGNDFKENFIYFSKRRLQRIGNGQIVKDRVLVPINLNNNHWVLLYITYPEQTIYYFDPFGG